MSNKPELVVQKLNGTPAITQEQLQTLIDSFPYGETTALVPFTAISEGFSVFGFMDAEVALSDRVNDGMVSSFQEMLLQESHKPIPAGAVKVVTPHGIRTNIIG